MSVIATEVIRLSRVPTAAAWIYPDGYDYKRGQIGWYFKYKGVQAYHGPYDTEQEAFQACQKYIAPPAHKELMRLHELAFYAEGKELREAILSLGAGGALDDLENDSEHDGATKVLRWLANMLDPAMRR